VRQIDQQTGIRDKPKDKLRKEHGACDDNNEIERQEEVFGAHTSGQPDAPKCDGTVSGIKDNNMQPE
jgi:hypothetical protein